MTPRLKKFVRATLLESLESRSEDLIKQYIEFKLASSPDLAHRLGAHTYDGAVARQDLKSKQELVARLEYFWRAAQGLAEQLGKGPASFDAQVLVADIRRFRHSAKGSVKKLTALDCDELFNLSSYINRDYAPKEERRASVSKHLGSILSEARAAVDRSEHPTHEMLEVLKETVEGYREYFDTTVRAFMGQSESVVDDGITGVDIVLGWINDGLSKKSKPREPEDIVALLKESEDISTTVGHLKGLAVQQIRAGHRDLAACLRELGLPLNREGLEAARASRVTDIVGTAQAQLDELRSFLEESMLIAVPDVGRIIVAPAEPFKAWSSAYVDQPGPFEQDHTTYYRISHPDPDWDEDEQREYLPFEEQLLSTTAHEVFPGHVIQNAHQRTNKTMIRAISKSSTFNEGWAHYAEQAVVDAGLRNWDPRVKIGQILKTLLRAARLAAVIELHIEKKSTEKVIAMFQRLAFVDARTAKQQTFRGVMEPGYMSYIIGKDQIMKLRDAFIRKGLGDVRAFHAWVLSYGSPPIPLLAAELKKFKKK